MMCEYRGADDQRASKPGACRWGGGGWVDLRCVRSPSAADQLAAGWNAGL